MFIRPRLFLTFLVFCVVPLGLLAAINYWYEARVAEIAVQREQESKSAEHRASINAILPQNQTESTSRTAASNAELIRADARRAGWLGLVAALFLATLSALLLTQRWQSQARRIERVSEGVEAIAKGELDHRIELRSSDDLRPLADNVGLMTKQLREQIAREAETRQFQSFVRLVCHSHARFEKRD